EANGLYSLVDAVITGHFSDIGQIDVAREAIARIRAAPREKAHRHAPEKPIIIVDPIMGDEGRELFIAEHVAQALAEDLVPLADIVAPNLWEFTRLTGAGLSAVSPAEEIAAAARARGGAWLISSVRTPRGIGAIHVDRDQTL